MYCILRIHHIIITDEYSILRSSITAAAAAAADECMSATRKNGLDVHILNDICHAINSDESRYTPEGPLVFRSLAHLTGK